MDVRVAWLDAGLVLLAERGVPALRIEALARALHRTKGSFYHHFVDLADYRRALLGHYEEKCTLRHISANSADVDRPAIERLRSLADRVLAEAPTHRGLDVSIRSWAVQDDDVRQTIQRVDRLRTDYLEGLATSVTGSTEAGRDAARTIYYLLIGSQHTVPPGSATELRRLWNGVLAGLERVQA